MKFTELFKNWIDGNKTPVAEREKSALLTEARSTILDITKRIDSGEIKVADQIDIVAAQYEKIRPNITPAKRPIYNRTPQAAPASKPTASAKPLPSPAPAPSPKPAQTTTRPIPSPAPAPETVKPKVKTVTAQEFLGEQVYMTRAEWQKLDQNKRAEFFRSGGKLAR